MKKKKRLLLNIVVLQIEQLAVPIFNFESQVNNRASGNIQYF